jgi:hypothetical protein
LVQPQLGERLFDESAMAAVTGVLQWEFRDVVVEQLNYFVDTVTSKHFNRTTDIQGDIQSAACSLLVLGDKTSDYIDETTQERWFSAYVGMCVRTRKCVYVTYTLYVMFRTTRPFCLACDECARFQTMLVELDSFTYTNIDQCQVGVRTVQTAGADATTRCQHRVSIARADHLR